MAWPGGAVCVPGLLDQGGARGHPERAAGAQGLLGPARGPAPRSCRPRPREAVQAAESDAGGAGCH